MQRERLCGRTARARHRKSLYFSLFERRTLACYTTRMMSNIRILAAALVCVVLGSAQEASQFAGAWQAKVKDSVVCTIGLKADDGGKLSGWMFACNVEADSDGNLIEAEPPDDTVKNPTPLVNVRFENGILMFAVKDDGGDEAIGFEMKLAGRGIADLRIVDSPVPIKPIRLTRLR